MPPLYVVEQGTKLSIDHRRLVIEKDGEALMKVPLAHTNAVILFGNISLTTPTMKHLLREGIDALFLTSHGDYEGRLVGKMSNFGLLRQSQYEQMKQESFALPMAQNMIYGKCHNMHIFIRRYQQRQDDLEMQQSLDRLKAMRDSTQRTTKLSGLRGVEGSATALYFSLLRKVFKHDWAFDNRNRRPPLDPVNVLLSFGYTLLARELEASVYIVGLDPYIGLFHTVEYGRPSLALDLMEEFRPIIVDSVVLRCLNNEIITHNDFTRSDDPNRPLVLSDDGKRRFIREWENRLQTEIIHPVTHEKMIYRRAFEIQMRLVAKCLREENPAFYKPFIVR